MGAPSADWRKDEMTNSTTMSYCKLSALPLDEYIKSNLSKTSLRTVKDVLLLPPITVMNLLHLSADQCKELMDYLFSMCVPQKLTAYEMEEMDQHNIPLGNNTFDSLLHGGLLSGSLTEFVGPPGIGKTQWCLDITAKVVVMGKGEGACPSAIYIDTEAAVRPERIVEMMMNRYPTFSSEIPQFLSRIHVFRPKTAASMLEILDSLEFVVVEKDARLVIVDSIASMTVSLSANSMKSRANQLSSWAAKLKSLAHKLNICIIVTNQITTVLKSQLSETSSAVDPWPHPENQVLDKEENVLDQEESVLDQTDHLPHLHHVESEGTSKFVIPALGNTWTHCITTRLILQYTDSSARQIVIAKSPVAPFAAFNYIIAEDGITIEEKDCCYSYSGPDPGLFRIRVQEGIPLNSL